MTIVQAEMLRLLGEIDEICEMLNLRYFVVDKQLLLSAQHRGISGYDVDVAMSYDDFIALKEYVETRRKEDRIIEGLEDNPDMPGAYYRYVNKQTLLYDLDFQQGFTTFGVAVNIHIIRNNSKYEKLLIQFERGMEATISRTGIPAVYRYSVKLARAVLSKRGLRKLVLFLFRHSVARDIQKPTQLRLPKGKVPKLPAHFWDRQSECIIEGRIYDTVENIPSFLGREYGSDWRKARPAIRKESYMCAKSVMVPYEQFVSEMSNYDYDKVFRKKRREYLRKSVEEVAPRTKVEKEGWNVMFGTEQRFLLYRKYMPQKEHILRLWNKGHRDEAMLILEEYRVQLSKYMRQGYAICFDPDIWNIVLQWYRSNNGDDFADQLEQAVRPEHLRPDDLRPEDLLLEESV